MAKQILFDKQASSAIKKGIDKLAAAVRMTLGPRGRAAVIETGFGAPQVTFDGVTVAKAIELQDKYENLGVEFLKQAAEKTDDAVKDGTTTAVVLAQAMIEEGEKVIIGQGFNVIKLAEELKDASKAIIDALDSEKEEISDDPKKVEEVATLAAKSKEIGQLVAKVIQDVGKDGVVSVEDSNTIGSSYEIVKGLQFDKGYISPYMVTNPEKMEAILEDPYILITDKKITSIQDILPTLETVAKVGKKELVIITEDIEGDALATLVVNKLRGILNVLAVKAPGFGDRKDEMLEDIAVVTGATVISEKLGLKLDKIDISHLGSARRIVSTKDNTIIVEGKGLKDQIDARIVQIRTALKETTSEFDKEKLQERLAKLVGGVAVIKVGAPTESEQKELKQRVEDAVGATRAATEEGIVPGGGIALFNINLERKRPTKEEIAPAVAAHNIITKALLAPLSSIIENSGQSSTEIIEELREKKKTLQGKEHIWYGFNAIKNELEDLRGAGIVDPLKVTKTAFLNAVSVASNYLTMGAAITDIPEKEDKTSQMPPMGMGGEY